MYRIALNTAISQFRKSKSNKIDFIDSYSEIISYSDNIDERNEDASLLFNAISQLSKVEKAIIMLYMDDCSYEEISEIIGVSVSNVGVKINRIKKKLREYLKDLGYEL
jgi:RNA polymerase sigma-70 factor (ECF subfamily)